VIQYKSALLVSEYKYAHLSVLYLSISLEEAQVKCQGFLFLYSHNRCLWMESQDDEGGGGG
jgi:hypothetical protein